MASDGGVSAALAKSKTALHDADNFGQRETGNKKAGDDAPKAHLQPNAPSYSMAAAERKAAPTGQGHEPIGGTTAGEINERLRMNDEAKKALAQ